MFHTCSQMKAYCIPKVKIMIKSNCQGPSAYVAAKPVLCLIKTEKVVIPVICSSPSYFYLKLLYEKYLTLILY